MATIQEAYNIASRMHQAGDLRQAEGIYRQIIQADPSHADAIHFLGAIALQSGKAAEAIDLMNRSISLRPNVGAYYNNLGSAYQAQGHYAQAVTAFESATRLQSDNAEFFSGLAQASFFLQDLPKTEKACHAGLRLNPNHPELWHTQGHVRRAQGRMDDAAVMYRRAIQFNPRHAAAHNNLACMLYLLGKQKDAGNHFRQALALTPNFADAHSNLGTLLQGMGNFDEAETHLREAIRLQPNIGYMRKNLGNVLQSQGKFDEAIACFHAAEQMAPDDARSLSNALLCMNYDPKIDTATLFAEHKRWASVYGRASTFGCSPGHDRDPNRRLKIGYVSSNFCVHPLTYFFEPILKHHDAGQVDVVCYSELPWPDATTGRLKAASSGWRDTLGQSDVDLANLIRSDKIDILVDLAGHTSGSRVRMFAHKPAPVQVNYLGYPYTSGLTTMDYRLTDAIADPPGEPVSYTEELFRLPGGFSCFDPGAGTPNVNSLPAARNGYVTFGSMHTLLRLNRSVVETWGQILNAVPNSRLLIYRDTLRGKVRNEIIRAFRSQGISPDRLDLQNEKPKDGNYLNLYHGIDISLDTFPWSGHTTSCQSLWMGLPVISLNGGRFAGRMVSSVLHQIGLERLAAQSPQEYVRIAGDLAGDIDALAALRGKLRAQVAGSPLCDYAGFTRNLERAYRQMWQKWCANTPS